MSSAPSYVICIPTLNAGKFAQELIAGLRQQRVPTPTLVIDSGSSDGTPELFEHEGFRVHRIPCEAFNHGATRSLCVEMNPDAEIVIFLTQDALLSDSNSLSLLLSAFEDNLVCAAYGRQLPRLGAGPIEAHARIFNYPEISRIKSLSDAKVLGIKVSFISNSFAAYRRSALLEVGGFPSRTILGEDTYVAAKMLLSGLKIAYVAEAKVYHSHDYSLSEEFRRYFDTGVFHALEPWIRQRFGQPEGEGLRYIRSELALLWGENPWLVPSSLIRSILKLLGFKLGLAERFLPFWLKRRLSMHQHFWQSRTKLPYPMSETGL
ncbi:MAG: glycosyltransferase [Gallionella sp.]